MFFDPGCNTIEEMRSKSIDRMQVEEIIILPYLIITESQIAPVLTYVLKKNAKDTTCQFVFEKEIIVTDQNVDAIVENGRDVLRKIMNATTVDKYSYVFKGLKMIGRKMIILFELKISYINLLMSSSSTSPIVFATVSELLNDMHVEAYTISEEVNTLFINNLEMCVLRDGRDAIYETPSVYYTRSPLNVIEHDALFCPAKFRVGDKLNVQYLENYRNSFRAKDVKSGVIRVCVFMCKHRVELQDIALEESLFDGFDSVSILSEQGGSKHYVKNQGQSISLSYYAM